MTTTAATAVLPDALASFAAVWNGDLEDVFVNAPGEFWCRRKGKTERHVAPDLDALAIEAIGTLAGHLRGQYADEQKPLMDCELASGERLSLVLPPCVAAGKPSLCIRRGPDTLPNLDDLDEAGLWDAIKARTSSDSDVSADRRKHAKALLATGKITAFFRYCVQQRWSISFVGVTGSGKTYSTNAIVSEIPLDARIVTVADSAEFYKLPHPNRVDFLYSEGGPATAEQLIKAALRSAPNWLLVNEVRDGAAFAYLRGLASGHPGMTTWHAQSAKTAFDALAVMIRMHPAGAVLPEASLRAMMSTFIDVIVSVERRDGKFTATDIQFGADL